jgi:hypothetical protein
MICEPHPSCHRCYAGIAEFLRTNLPSAAKTMNIRREEIQHEASGDGLCVYLPSPPGSCLPAPILCGTAAATATTEAASALLLSAPPQQGQAVVTELACKSTTKQELATVAVRTSAPKPQVAGTWPGSGFRRTPGLACLTWRADPIRRPAGSGSRLACSSCDWCCCASTRDPLSRLSCSSLGEHVKPLSCMFDVRIGVLLSSVNKT